MPAMRVPRPRTLVLSLVVCALAAVSVGALQRELAPRPRAAAAPMVFWQGKPLQKPLTADEESYAEALWPIQAELVETSAVAMSFAGMAYMTEGHDAQKLATSARTLQEKFAMADARTKALATPESMLPVQQRYLGAISAFETASAEMAKVGDDGKLEHLVEAQAMSQRAAEDLLRVGDVLWPGEHKPN